MHTFLTEASFWTPKFFVPSAWTEHAPFGFWLVDALRPRLLTELGTHYGFSYFVFTQAVKALQAKSRCFAVDTWKGDEHAGHYGEEVYESVRTYNDSEYADFSELVRSSFDDAVSRFENGTIDLLHIDGRHFYEDVKHDFEAWKPKLSTRSVVLFHDTSVSSHGFGVYRLWDELKRDYPYFEFIAGHGLGVLGTGSDVPPAVKKLFQMEQNEPEAAFIRAAYQRLGAGIVDRALLQQQGGPESQYNELLDRHHQLDLLYKELRENHLKLDALYHELVATNQDLRGANHRLEAELGQLRDNFANARQESEQKGERIIRLLAECEWRRNTQNEFRDRYRASRQKLRELQKSTAMLSARMKDQDATLQLALERASELEKNQGAGQLARPTLQESINLLRSSSLFDERFYLGSNPDVASSGSDPLEHYLVFGGSEGRNPHVLFDSNWYLSENPDVAAAQVNPLIHYMQQGFKEGRDPHPFFDSDWYLRENPDLFAAGLNPLEHFIETGAAEGRSPSPFFDGKFYLESNPDVAAYRTNPLVHFLLFGAKERRLPHAGFDPEQYARDHPGTESQANPVLHFVERGIYELLRKGRPKAKPPLERRPRIVFLSGEPDTAGHHYRIENFADVLPSHNFDVVVIAKPDLSARIKEMEDADLLWIWRATWSEHIACALENAKQSGCKIVFDVDDLMFRPELAKSGLIDGIRTQGLTETQVHDFYASIHDVFKQADHCITPTITLAREARTLFRPSSVIPNGFSSETLRRFREMRLDQSDRLGDGIVRIGYAAGTLTHQRDLQVASSALARTLAEFPHVRLVLFRDTINLAELPELQARSSQIEWRKKVPVHELPAEYTRFDINIAPLELGNRYCESKSELKYFEAALAGVPTVATPTQPFADAIRHAITGFLPKTGEQWYACLKKLIQNPALRTSMAQQAYSEALWLYGPERRHLLLTRLIHKLLSSQPVSAQLFIAGLQPEQAPLPRPDVPLFDILFQSKRRSISRVSVVMPLFNYAHLVLGALESVRAQTVKDIDLVIVDDCSSDASASVARGWLEEHAEEFNAVALLQNRVNSKLGRTRNAGVAFCDTELYLPLDPDNLLLPDCIEKSLQLLDETGAAFAYPTIRMFGDSNGMMGFNEFDPSRFQSGNYIDAMAMVRKACWIAVGGYSPLEPVGWEDYDFWCKLIEKGLFGVRVPHVIAKYRVHENSMLRTITELPENKPRVIRDLSRRHPWLQLKSQEEAILPEREVLTAANGAGYSDALSRLLPYLRCPETGEDLIRVDESTLATKISGRTWPVVHGRPVFTEEGTSVLQYSEDHVSNPIPEEAIRIIQESDGMVLNLSAGASAVRYPNVIELEYSIFKSTDVIGDVHRLPFHDEVFEAVVCLNAFEHYREPDLAMDEVRRVLKPGGRLFLHTAFLQPLHEAPHHYYNCTEFGLKHWLRKFDTQEIRVSENFNPAYVLSWLASDMEFEFRSAVSEEAAELFNKATMQEFSVFWRDPASRSSELWSIFQRLPLPVQRRFAAGWEAVATKTHK